MNNAGIAKILFAKRTLTGIIFFCLIALVGCARPFVEPIDLPTDVAMYVPSDIDPSEVNRDTQGCYFYVYAAELILIRDRNGQPICSIP